MTLCSDSSTQANAQSSDAAVDVALAVEGLGRQPFALAQLLGEILVQAAGIEPLVAFAGDFVDEGHAQVRAQHRLRAQHLLELRHGELVGVEVLRIGPEPQGRAGARLRHVAHHLELRGLGGRPRS